VRLHPNRDFIIPRGWRKLLGLMTLQKEPCAAYPRKCYYYMLCPSKTGLRCRSVV
jgi:hypothetical protein